MSYHIAHPCKQHVTLFGAEPPSLYDSRPSNGLIDLERPTMYTPQEPHYIVEQQTPQQFERLPPIRQHNSPEEFRQPATKVHYGVGPPSSRMPDTSSESQQFIQLNRANDYRDGLPQIYRNTTMGMGPPPTGVFDRIVMLYTQSAGTVDFMRNMRAMIFQSANPWWWIILVCCAGLAPLAFILVAVFNLQTCRGAPLIPIYLLIIGILLVVKCACIMFQIWPTPEQMSSSGGQHSVAMSTATSVVTHRTNSLEPIDVACTVLDTMVNIAIVIWTVLGCIWIYTADIDFSSPSSMRYCNSAIYHLSFTIITAQLILTAAAFGMAISLIVMVIMCASQQMRHESEF